MSGIRYFMIHDLVDRSDPRGRTIREVNLAREHLYPIGSLVEVEGNSDWNSNDGQRLYVAAHNRDCDGSPLYGLAFNLDSHPDTWVYGIGETALHLVRHPKPLTLTDD